MNENKFSPNIDFSSGIYAPNTGDWIADNAFLILTTLITTWSKSDHHVSNFDDFKRKFAETNDFLQEVSFPMEVIADEN